MGARKPVTAIADHTCLVANGALSAGAARYRGSRSGDPPMDALKERLTARWTVVYRDGRVPLSAPGASAAGAERLHL
jgi:hypothetical protein